MTSSFKAFFTSSRAPMSSNLMPISPGGTTAEIKFVSYSSFARFYHSFHMLENKQKKLKFPYCIKKYRLLKKLAFKFCEGFRDIASCSFNLKIASSRLYTINKISQRQYKTSICNMKHRKCKPFTRKI